MAGKEQRRASAKTPAPAPQAPTVAPKAKPVPEPPAPPAGLFPNLGMNDETAAFGKMNSGDRSKPIAGIVEHRTESPTMESARNSYRGQVAKGSSVGAHYLIGTDGATSLTVPTDKKTSHVRGNKDSDWKGANAWSIGIENVGMPAKIDGDKDVHKQVAGLSLPPAMRERLLGMDEAALKTQLEDGVEGGKRQYALHTDIPGPQKRANYNLVNQLTAAHGLDPATQVKAHEQVDEKTTGEGEPIIEFLSAMRDIPSKIAALEARIAKMQADGGPEGAIAGLTALLHREQATQRAIAADKTPAENLALEGEKTLAPEGGSAEGPAHEREQQRVDFYDNFWARKLALDAAATGTPTPGARHQGPRTDRGAVPPGPAGPVH